MPSPKRLIISVAIALLITLAGCAWFEPKEEKSAQELAAIGMDLYQRGKYRQSKKTFQKLKDGYPFSQYTSLAELKIADAHYQLEEYEEAIFAYQEFQSLHPQNEAIPYVVYQVGRCYFDRMDTVDRDQTTVRQALEIFKQMVNQYPQSAYASKARAHIEECRKSLAGHEMYVGEYYFNAKQYKGAMGRFQGVLKNYPGVGFDEKAREYIARCRTALENETEK